MSSTYFLEEGTILYRRLDGERGQLPDEILFQSGWSPFGPGSVSRDSFPPPTVTGAEADPLMFTTLERLTESEAKAAAQRLGKPVEGW